MNEARKREFWEKKNEGFAPADPSQDLLHPEYCKIEPGYQLTETQYFGFNIPEHRLHGLAYIWYHPNLKTVTGGAYAWIGIKEHNFECELFDFVTYMNDECLKNDLWDYKLENSYHVQTIEPLKRHRIRYEDPVRGNKFDIHYEAIMPPMIQASGQHLEQTMRTTGTITLRGKEYQINGYNIRDRSWGALRHEKHTNMPPLNWMTGILDETFAFGCTAFDTPELSEDSYPGLAIPGGSNVKGGWVYRDGQMVPILSARKRTIRDRRTLIPQVVEMTLTDSLGREYEIKGTITAAANWRVWHNFDSWICQARWEYDGKVFYGDAQECHWADFVYAARRDYLQRQNKG
jgi:hypothetical protein